MFGFFCIFLHQHNLAELCVVNAQPLCFLLVLLTVFIVETEECLAKLFSRKSTESHIDVVALNSKKFVTNPTTSKANLQWMQALSAVGKAVSE
jgi:hypothetical protein